MSFQERLQEITDNDPNEIKEFVDMYLEDLSLNLELIDEVILAKDLEKLRGIAHKIKGASSNLGIQEMEKVALELEQLCHAGQADEAESKIVPLKEKAQTTSEELRGYLKSLA